jgi:tetratricopeptide (TPR) repeat protein
LVVTVVVTLLAGGVAAGAALYAREKRLRRTQRAAEAWARLAAFANRQDVPAVRAELGRIAELTPDSAGLARWRTALETGRADPADQVMVRLVMNEHLRVNRLDEAAREAAVRVAALPRDWQARCVLAHHALTRGRRDEARDHVAALPSPFDVEAGVGPGPLLYALQLSQQLGAPVTELTNYLVAYLLPALHSQHVPHIQLTEKFQLLDAYLAALAALDAHPDLGQYWVPAAALGRGLLDDPALGTDDLVRLGHIFERFLPYLAELRRRGKFPAADADRLGRELEERVRAVWAKVHDRDPKLSAGYIGLALAEFRAGRAAEAEATLRRGLETCGSRDELVAALGRLYQAHDPAAGLALLTRAVRDRPGEPALLKLLADVAAAAHRPDVVLEATAEALRIKPDLPWACLARGRTLLALGRPAEAAVALGPIRERLLGDEGGAGLYVRALAAADTLPAAESFLQEAAGRPGPAPALRGGARALLAAGRPEPAARWAEEAVRRSPDDRSARLLLADSLRAWAEQEGAPGWDAGRVHAAVLAYDWLRHREPANLAAANNVAWLQLKGLGQPIEAYRSAAPLRAREDDADLPAEMLETLGAVYLAMDDEAKAARLLERATQSDPTRPGYWTHLALAYLRLGRRADAGPCLDRAARRPKSTREADEWVRARRLYDAAPPAARDRP